MIVLTLEESDTEYVSGFPEYLIFGSSKPATIFYTLDGTTPDVSSLIAVGNVHLPTSGSTVTLKAIAISPDDTSAVLEAEYKTDASNLDGARRLGHEGIAVVPFGSDAVDSISFDSDGGAAQATAVELIELDIKASREDSKGLRLDPQKTSSSLVNFALKSSQDTMTNLSTPNDNADFDPSAKFITIDGTTDADFENQVVKIVNRTYNTFGPTSKFYDERLGQKEPVVTGNYLRSFYNPKTGVYISYYWESLESRWIKSIQTIELKRLNIGPNVGVKFVYRWIQDRALSQLF